MQAQRQQRKCTVVALRDETAQVLALVLVEIAGLTRLQDVTELHARLSELRGAVGTELGRVLQLADVLERMR